jgi:hypothetical protein
MGVESFGIDFGRLIAILLPGFIALWGLSLRIVPLSRLFTLESNNVGARVTLLLVLSIATGLLLNPVRFEIMERPCSG